MAFGATVTLYFVNKMGEENVDVRREAGPDILFSELVFDVAKKFGIPSEWIIVSTHSGMTITKSDFNLPIKEIRRKYNSDRFTLSSQGDVG